MQPRFNFSQFYENEQLSDVLLLVRIDGDVKQRIPGHGIVLANVSHVFRDEIEQQQGLGGKPAIHLNVQPDQVPAACALVRFVYTGDLPDPTPSQQPLLVHMLHLAHTFGVTDCRTACFNVLLQCHQLQPEPLGLAFMLLAPLTASTAAAAPAHARATAAPGPGAADFKQLLDHCLGQLQQQLGDMEAVLSCPDLVAQLHSLPLPALLALLHDERTSAASENTVLAAVHSWMTAAAQRDVRVDAVQREQLAAAVRVPLLEPCYLGTVLPRMAWLLEILGPQGLATVAGVARGLCDPHAEPVLSNARACGSLAAGWLKGPRPVPTSCSRAMHGGPALTIDWALPLSDIKAAFEASCADIVAKALARQHQQASAAAAAQQAALVSNEPPTWGLGSFRSPLAPASAAAAMSAVASVAAAAAARVFSKRKRSCMVTESYDGEGRDQQSSSTAALGPGRNREQLAQHQDGVDAEDGQEAAGPLLSQPRSPGMQEGHQSQGGVEGAEDLPQHTRKRRRRAAGASANAPDAEQADAAAAAATATARAGSSQGAGKLPALQTQQQGGRPYQPLSLQAVAAETAAGGAAAGAFFSQDPAAASAPTSPRGLGSFSSGAQHLPRQFKVRSKEAQFAGYTWRLVLYFQPKGAADDAAGTDAGAAAGCGEADMQHAEAGASGGVARQAVAAAHAVRLPDDSAGAAAGVASCMWSARLAVEAWPAVALQPASNSSTVAFSGSLGVLLAPEGIEVGPAAAAAAGGGRAKTRSKVGSKQRKARGRSGAASPAADKAAGVFQDAAPSAGRRLHMAASDSPARYATCPEAAAAAAAAAAGSPAGRKLAAGGADGHRGLHAHAGLMSIPESDEEDQPESSGPLSSSSDEEQDEAAAVQDSEGDDEGFTMLGEYPAGTTPRSSRLRKQQQQQRGRSARRRPASGGGQEEQQQQDAVTPGVPAGPGVDDGEDDDEGTWRVLQLPQGSWLRSRRCDTGYTSFFSITLHQAEWDEAAWRPYLQPSDMLQLRGTIWNVR